MKKIHGIRAHLAYYKFLQDIAPDRMYGMYIHNTDALLYKFKAFKTNLLLAIVINMSIQRSPQPMGVIYQPSETPTQPTPWG